MNEQNQIHISNQPVLQYEPYNTQTIHNTIRLALAQRSLPRTDQSALQAELDWAHKRPESLWKQWQHDGDTNTPLLDHMVATDVGELTPFEACLTKTEREFFNTYMELFPDSVYSLNQDPKFKPMYAHGKARTFVCETVLSCLHCSSSLVYISFTD